MSTLKVFTFRVNLLQTEKQMDVLRASKVSPYFHLTFQRLPSEKHFSEVAASLADVTDLRVSI